MRKQEKVIMWPAYFDATKTRKNGRRVPRNLAVSSPKVSEIKDATDRLHRDCELVLDAAYPKMPWLKTGMALVKKNRSKDYTIQEITAQLLKIRNTSAATKQ
ncbi:signal recognition particle protein Srp19 [Candidatus Bathyarchaeota archaeon]|nr:signal recognition particle protein Srp19 [Candidatus Bathyarchaeota archaeon]